MFQLAQECLQTSLPNQLYLETHTVVGENAASAELAWNTVSEMQHQQDFHVPIISISNARVASKTLRNTNVQQLSSHRN